MALSPEARAAISAGLRRYYMERGSSGAASNALHAGSRRYAAGRSRERDAITAHGAEGNPLGRRASARSRTTRTDRLVSGAGSIARLHQARVRVRAASEHEPEPHEPHEPHEPAPHEPTPHEPRIFRSPEEARAASLHADLQTEEGRTRLANAGVLQRSGQDWVVTEHGRRMLGPGRLPTGTPTRTPARARAGAGGGSAEPTAEGGPARAASRPRTAGSSQSTTRSKPAASSGSSSGSSGGAARLAAAVLTGGLSEAAIAGRRAQLRRRRAAASARPSSD